MAEFATKGDALFAAPSDWLVRLLMCGVPIATFRPDHLVMSATTALWLGTIDGLTRWFGSCTCRALVATSEGLRVNSWVGARVVPWSNVLAIRNWRHLNGFDFVAVYYRRAGRLEIATCLDQDGEDELRAFVRACADFVVRDSPRFHITLAGLCDECVYLPLFRRFTQDVGIATLMGCVWGIASAAFALGLLSALQSAFVVATRHPFRTTTLEQRAGLWSSPGPDARPLRVVPRPLRLWVRGLAEASYRIQASSANQ